MISLYGLCCRLFFIYHPSRQGISTAKGVRILDPARSIVSSSHSLCRHLLCDKASRGSNARRIRGARAIPPSVWGRDAFFWEMMNTDQNGCPVGWSGHGSCGRFLDRILLHARSQAGRAFRRNGCIRASDCYGPRASAAGSRGDQHQPSFITIGKAKHDHEWNHGRDRRGQSEPPHDQ